MSRILPGDLVSFNAEDPDCTCSIIDNVALKPPAKGIFNTEDEAAKLQRLWRARQVIMSRAVYLVLCASKDRCLAIHPQGLLVLSEGRFLRRINVREADREGEET